MVAPGTNFAQDAVFEGQVAPEDSSQSYYGRVVTANTIYEGQFVKDQASGYGILRHDNGTELSGIWYKNQLVGNATKDFV